MPGLPQAQPGVSGPVRAPMAAPATRKPATPALAALRTAGGRGGGPMSLY
jgi:hypothetical protein